MMTNKLQESQWAGIHWNEKFLCVETYSGYGRCVADPDVAPYLLSTDVDDATLGKTTYEALSLSRCIPLEAIGEFFDLKRTKAHYERWVTNMMECYGYKTRRALFKRMLSCGIRQQEGVITFSPSRKDRLEAWGRTKQDIAAGMVDEVISDAATPVEIGAALRRAMNRCL